MAGLLLVVCQRAASVDPPAAPHVVIGLFDTVATLGPVPGYTNDDVLVGGLMFEGLTRLDRDGRPQPALAASWHTPDGGRTWDFTLRPGAQFHDGTPLTGAAVVQAWRAQWRHPRWRDARPTLALIAGTARLLADSTADSPGVRVRDARTVHIALTEPLLDLPAFLALPIGWVAAPAAAAGRPPVGSGPWRLARGRARDSLLTFVRAAPTTNADDTLLVRVVPLDAPTGDLLAAGTIDWTIDIGTREYVDLAMRRDVRLVATRPTHLRRLVFSDRQPLLRDAALRRAMAMAIDRRALVTARPGVPLEPALDIVPAHGQPWGPRDPIPYAPAAARRAARAAGYDSATMPLRLVTWASTQRDSTREVAWLVRDYLRAAGYRVELRFIDDDLPISRLVTHDSADLAIDIVNSALQGLAQQVALSLGLDGHEGEASVRPGDEASRRAARRLLLGLRAAQTDTERRHWLGALARHADATVGAVGLWWQPELIGCSPRLADCPAALLGNRFEAVRLRAPVAR